jgi:hypothetical protein
LRALKTIWVEALGKIARFHWSRFSRDSCPASSAPWHVHARTWTSQDEKVTVLKAPHAISSGAWSTAKNDHREFFQFNFIEK